MTRSLHARDPSRQSVNCRREGSEVVLPPLAIVWRCPLSVEQYLERGRKIEVPRLRCPDCEGLLRFRSGYWRHVRSGGTGRPAWVRRAQCVGCRRSHAMLPSFLLHGRLDVVDRIGAIVEAVIDDGTVTGAAAKAADVPYTTARDWLRRLRARAGMLAAGLVAVAVEVGAEATVADLAVDAARRVLGALRLVAQAVGSSPSPWALASLITGGKLLGTTTDPPWTLPGGRRVMPPVP
jgi:molybdenum-dependent DNA-binding transcriptional regulator ModE